MWFRQSGAALSLLLTDMFHTVPAGAHVLGFQIHAAELHYFEVHILVMIRVDVDEVQNAKNAANL